MRQTTANSFFKRGCHPDFDEETNRRILVVNLFSFVGYTITLVLGFYALFSGTWTLGFSLLTASLIFFLASQIQVAYRNKVGQVVSVYLLTGCLMGLETYLLVTGGHDNTGPLWLYILPPVAMFFGGFKRGLIVMAVFTLLITIILFSPHGSLLLTHYSDSFKTRLLLSFCTVTFLSAFYESSRQNTYEMMRMLSAQFEQQALHDTLTSLPNRRGISQLLDQEIKRHYRTHIPLTLILVDVDKFKQINDTYGHNNGDIVLQRTAQHLRQNVRRQDIVSRWGGEEFLMVLPETSEQSAAILAEKVRETLENTAVWLEEREIKVTASFGICEINSDISLNRGLSLADKALYKAKQLGRNKVVCAHDMA
mgnify:CR=1 FL=1